MNRTFRCSPHKLNGQLFIAGLVVFLVSVTGFVSAVAGQGINESSAEEKAVTFGDIFPILRKRCSTCHNPEEMRGDLDLMSMVAVESGSASGPVIVPGKPLQSLLYTTAAHVEDPTMPPNSKQIPARELDMLRRWIESLGESRHDTEVAIGGAADEGNRNPSTATGQIIEQAMVFADSVRALRSATPLVAMAVHPLNSLVAVPGNGQIVLLEEGGIRSRAIEFKEDTITELRFSADGETLLVGGGKPGESGLVYGFDVNTGQQRFCLGNEYDSVLSVDLAPAQELLALSGPGKAIKVHSVASGELRYSIEKHTDWVLDLSFSPDGLLLASGDRFGGLFVFEARTGEVFHTLRGHVGPVNAIAWDPDGETLVSAGEDGLLRIWNMHHGELTSEIDLGIGAILDIDIGSAAILAAGREGVALRSNFDGKIQRRFAGQLHTHGAFLPEMGLLAVAKFDGQIGFVDQQTLELRNQMQLPVMADGNSKLLARLKQQSEAFENTQVAMLNESNLVVGEPMVASSANVTERWRELLEQQLLELEAELESEQRLQTELAASIAQAQQTLERLKAIQTQLDARVALAESKVALHRQQLLQLRKAIPANVGVKNQASADTADSLSPNR